MIYKSAILAIFLMILSCTANASLELKVVNRSAEQQTAAESRAGELIVEVRRGVIDLEEEKGIILKDKVNIKSSSLKSLNEKNGLISIEKLFSGTRQDTPSDIYVFRFSPQANLNELVSAYRKDSNVIYTEPNYMVRTQRE